MQVEKLIKELPSAPADGSNGNMNLTDKSVLSNGTSLPHMENGTSLRETQSMLLERISSEMNRLKFYIAHAQVSSILFTKLSSIMVYVLERFSDEFPGIYI